MNLKGDALGDLGENWRGEWETDMIERHCIHE